jgi:hypothetical protein
MSAVPATLTYPPAPSNPPAATSLTHSAACSAAAVRRQRFARDRGAVRGSLALGRIGRKPRAAARPQPAGPAGCAAQRQHGTCAGFRRHARHRRLDPSRRLGARQSAFALRRPQRRYRKGPAVGGRARSRRIVPRRARQYAGSRLASHRGDGRLRRGGSGRQAAALEPGTDASRFWHRLQPRCRQPAMHPGRRPDQAHAGRSGR